MSKRKKSEGDPIKSDNREIENCDLNNLDSNHQNGLNSTLSKELTYDESDGGPFVIHIEKLKEQDETNEPKELNVLKLGKLCSINLYDTFQGAYGLKTTGFNRFKVFFIKAHMANKFLKDFNNKATTLFKKELWKASIPMYRKAFSYIIHGINDSEVTDKEIIEHLSPPPGWQGTWKNCVQAERMKRVEFVKEGENTIKSFVDTNMFKVQFDWSGVPDKGVFWGLIVKITPYIDKVRRCSHCHRFGHIQKFCRNKNKDPICGKCAETGHESAACASNVRRCINCIRARLEDTDHPAVDRNCPLFKVQKDIKKVMATRKLGPKEAINILEKNGGRPPPLPRSYAEATRINLGDLIKISKYTRYKKKAKTKRPNDEEFNDKKEPQKSITVTEKYQEHTNIPNEEMEIIPDSQESTTREDELLQEILVNQVGSLVRETLYNFGLDKITDVNCIGDIIIENLLKKFNINPVQLLTNTNKENTDLKSTSTE